MIKTAQSETATMEPTMEILPVLRRELIGCAQQLFSVADITFLPVSLAEAAAQREALAASLDDQRLAGLVRRVEIMRWENTVPHATLQTI